MPLGQFVSQSGTAQVFKEAHIPMLKGREAEVEFPVHKGGGWYLLSNGEKIRGKADAILAEAELKES